ncbi:MAG TPA: hypothetical protein VEY69_15095, partial [Lautropia sp.]|nr:hypothetical protein [Lautropia sp.]
QGSHTLQWTGRAEQCCPIPAETVRWRASVGAGLAGRDGNGGPGLIVRTRAGSPVACGVAFRKEVKT